MFYIFVGKNKTIQDEQVTAVKVKATENLWNNRLHPTET